MNYNFIFSREHAAIIGAALAELPYKISAPVIMNMQAQINVADSNEAAKAAHSEPPAKED